jgi:hypothetical protein
MRTKLLLSTIAAALLAACSGNGGQTPPVTRTAQAVQTGPNTMVQDGYVLHIFPTKGTPSGGASVMAGATTTSNLLYHGGPVQVTPHLYVVFWGSSWNSSAGDPDGVAGDLLNFYGAIGGSKWLATVTQYYQSNGSYVGNPRKLLTGSYVDTSSNPPLSPTNNQLAAEAAAAAAHFGDYSVGASYVVALPHGISPGGFAHYYCAWHSTTSANGSTIAFTNLPYIPDAGYNCGAGSVNTPGTLDGVSIVAGHEQAETETDPQINAWYDSSGQEIGDKCAWMNLEDNPYAGGFPTQPLWSNASSSCVQSF